MLRSAVGTDASFGRSKAKTGQAQVFFTFAIMASLSSWGIE
jgi:hypothetical protein